MSNNKTTKATKATEEAKARVKFTGVEDEDVNNALNDYNDVRKRNGLEELTQDRVDVSTRGFNNGDELLFGDGAKWNLVVGEVKDASGKVTETYPAITNGAVTLSIKALCKQIISGFSIDHNAVFYSSATEPETAGDFTTCKDYTKASPTLDSKLTLETVANYMKPKSEFSPLRLWCEIKAGKSNILQSFRKLVYHGTILKQGVRKNRVPFINKIAVWEMVK